MKRRILSLMLTAMIILVFMTVTSPAATKADEPEYAWILVEINDYENADKWALSDAHDSYIVTYSYSRGTYSASTTYEGDDPYGTGLGGALAVRAVFSGMPDIIYPDKPVSLELTFVPTENTVVKLAFSAYAGANFDQWDVPTGGMTGRAIRFVNDDGKDSFKITAQNSESYDETLTATLGSGYENSRIALRLGFYMGASMGTNYVYEWKQVEDATVETTETEPTPAQTTKPRSSPVQTQDSSKGPTICKIGDLHGEVNVKPNDEDDDAYIFAEPGMYLYHNDRIRTLTRSGCIISFSDLSTYIMKEDTSIVLDIANEKESKIALIAGNVWVNLKKMIKDGSMEVEMSQAIAGARGTTFICEEANGVSVLKVFEGTVEYKSKTSGESVMVKGGQMARADSSGIGEIVPFDMDTELETWDESTRELTADVLAGNKGGLSIGVILIIAGAVLAIVIVMVILKRRRTVPSTSSAYPQAPVHQTSTAQNEKTYRSSAKFCANCGNTISPDSKFCAKCGRSL